MYNNILMISSLGHVLDAINTITVPDGQACGLFITANSPTFSKDMLAALVAGGSYDETDDILEELKQKHMVYTLELQLAQSIVQKAKWDKPNATFDDLVDALYYFLENDAFLHIK